MLGTAGPGMRCRPTVNVSFQVSDLGGRDKRYLEMIPTERRATLASASQSGEHG